MAEEASHDGSDEHRSERESEIEEDFHLEDDNTVANGVEEHDVKQHHEGDEDDDMDHHRVSSDDEDYDDPVIAPVDSAVIQTAEAVSIQSPPSSSKEEFHSPTLEQAPTLPLKSPNRARYSLNSNAGDTITPPLDSEQDKEDVLAEDENAGTETVDQMRDISLNDSSEALASGFSQSPQGTTATSASTAPMANVSPAMSRRTSSESNAPPLPPRKRAPFFWLRTKSPRASMSSMKRHGAGFGSMASSEYDLVMQRLDANKERLASQKTQDGNRDAFSGIREIQKNFEDVRSHPVAVEYDHEDQQADIDWEFWSSVVSDYAGVAKDKPQELSRAIASGFPAQLRGLIWQLIAASKNGPLEEMYQSILQESSPHEKAIKRDLARTSFIANADPDSLFRMIKAYSLYDPEVGYTQGMAFIAVPLLLNMSEPEAFCLLVCLMKDYGLRSLFLPEMPGLHLRLYQFDRIIEDTLPSLHIHLSRQGVRSSMYASQWFLTLFAYKFPLQIVMRIFDIVMAEGVEAILRFGVALMRKNAQTLLGLEFDTLLTFLKERIFDCYLLEAAPEPIYKVNELVEDAYEVKVMPVTLRKYENEYTEIHRIERERVEEVESLRSSNGVLTSQVRRLEAEMAALNKEHIQIANEMVQGRLEIAKLRDENEQLNIELQELRPADESQEDGTARGQAGADDPDSVRQQNLELLETKERLESQLTNLERELLDTKQELASLEDEHKALKTRWTDLGKHFNEFK